MHTDEAVNAYLLGETIAGKPFEYDAADRHGPAFFALALPVVRGQGAQSYAELTEVELRLVSVLAGSIGLLLFGAAVEMFGFVPCLVAAVLTAVAPLPLYYDRYFIHEPLLACASFLLMIALWKLWRHPSPSRAALAGTCLAVMISTKETALLNIAALAIGAYSSRSWLKQDRGTGPWPVRVVAAAGFGTFLVVSVLLFTWFGRDNHVGSQLLHALPRALARARGEGHQKALSYYIQLLAPGWSGAAVGGLACVGAIVALRHRASAPCYGLLLYGSLLAAIYSCIPYKTPWIALNLWVPFALLVGVAVQSGFRRAWAGSRRNVFIPLLLVSALVVGSGVISETRKRVYIRPADEHNPYAYAHTSEDFLDLPPAIDRLAKERGIASPRIAVMAADPWPLPWYLRRYKQTGYWQPAQDPGPADFYITSTDAAEQYKATLQGFVPEFFGERPGVLILVWSHEREPH